MILTCIWRYATWSSLAFSHMRMGMGWGGVGIIPNRSIATLHDLHLHLMLRYMIFTCTWCYATWSSLAFSHIRMGWGWFQTGLLLLYMIFTCIWCYATWSWLALDNTLHDYHLHLMQDLHLHVRLPYMIFTCTWSYATSSSLAFDAMLHDLHLHLMHDLHLHLMLGHMIFTCTWCHATWSSLEFDATLHDLHLHFHRWGWGRVQMGWGGDNTKRVSCYATWSSLAFDAASNSKKRPGGKYVKCQVTWSKTKYIVVPIWQNAFFYA